LGTQENEVRAVHKPSLHAVGMRWEGTFGEAEAGGIRAVQREFKRRLSEIGGRTNDGILLGLSYHAAPGADRFTHYSAVEVAERGQVPEGMTEIEVPALTYARTEHRKGQSIEWSYRNVYQWMDEQGYSPLQGGPTHFEEYPLLQDPDDPDPEFVILIPMEKKQA